MLGRSSQSSFSASSSSAREASWAAVAVWWPDAERSSSIRTLMILRGAGMMVYWSGS